MRRRNEVDIWGDILTVAQGGAKKTKIVYQANLNFKIGKKYIDHLISSGLLRGPRGENQIFRTTEKGVGYINYFNGFKEYMNLQGIASYKYRHTNPYP